MTPTDAERQELERAVELMGRTTRHGRLLAYLGEKYFDHQEAQLTEFNLATEFFGRSADRFDASQDAVVRVEVHRLRKKLREIYDKGTGPHGRRISLPAGSYVPQFSRPEEAPAPPGNAADDAPVNASAEAGPPETGGDSAPQPRRGSTTAYLLAAAALIAAVSLGVWLARPGAKIERSSTRTVTAPTPGSAVGQDPLSEVRVIAGYTGSDIIDSSGERWTSDRFFSGGGVLPNIGRIAKRTSRPFLYANWRSGEFAYNVPLKKGVYELRLFFISAARPSEERLADFNVFLNGQPLLTSYDSYASTQSVNYADEVVFKDVSPDRDGLLKLWFLNAIETPMLNALEIVPGIPGRLKPIRIVTQPMSFVDHKGQRWRADDYFLGGIRSTDVQRVGGTEDPVLFGGERFGNFSYAIPVDARGTYTVVLHFAELYFGPQLPGGGGSGSRIFHVYCNGKTLLEDFDVFEEAGSRRVISKTFHKIRPSAQGKINLTFEPVINNATVSGIEILDESR